MNVDKISLEDIKAMDTIHQGQYDDLKYEGDRIRIWLSRVEEDKAEVEYFDGDRWLTKIIITKF